MQNSFKKSNSLLKTWNFTKNAWLTNFFVTTFAQFKCVVQKIVDKTDYLYPRAQ